MSRTRNPLPLLLSSCLALPLALPTISAHAEEGMWLPDQVKTLEPQLKAMGMKLDAGGLADFEKGTVAAVVSISVGGTGSFVSPDGLIVTNHHIVYDAVQQNSDAAHDYIHDGFLAESREKELPAPGYKVTVTRAMTDVTLRILAEIPKEIDDRTRHDIIDRHTKELVAECEKDSSQRCRVSSMFGGLKYYLIAQTELRDVRLVYAPSDRIGNYGGEIDNYRWPRHVGDYGFLRAYVGPDGKPADYGSSNLPYHPPVHLALASVPLKENDLTLTWGFPGSTQRYRTATEIDFAVEKSLPSRIAHLTRSLELIDEAAKTSRDRAIRLSGMRENLGNGLTNSAGKLIALKRTHLVDARRKAEAGLTTWIDADPARKQTFGSVLPDLDALSREAAATWPHDSAVYRVGSNSDLLQMAIRLVRNAEERAKPDLERDPSFMARNLPRVREELELAQKDLDPALDRLLMIDALNEAMALPADQRFVELDAHMKLHGMPPAKGQSKSRAVQAWADRLYKGTRMGQLKYRLELFDGGAAAVKASHDPLIELARALQPAFKRLEEKSKVRDGAMSRLRPRLLEAWQAFDPHPMYPDANFTMRLSYGTVKGYFPEDGAYALPFTTVAGVVAKHTGKEPFDSPPALLKAAEGRGSGSSSGQVAVNVLTTNDTTGGNSGSPVLNGRGELVGLLFDGNYESTADDYVFWDAMQRSIVLDMRYVLWLMENVDHATTVLKETGWSSSRLPVEAPPMGLGR